MLVFAHIRTSFADAFFPRLSEWWLAGMLFGLGWMLSVNPDLMASGKTQAYQLMLMIFSQETWSWIMRTFAVMRLTILLINGAWRRSPHLRAFTAFLTMFFWTQIALSFAPTFGYAFVFSSGAVVLDFLNMVRAARDARTVDYAHAKGRAEGGTS